MSRPLAWAAALAAFGAAARAEAPLTLDEALTAAARDSRDLAIARADAAAARADAGASWAGFLPRLDLTTTLGRQVSGPQAAQTYVLGGVPVAVPAQGATDQEAYFAQVQLQQPIFDGLRNVREVESAHAQERAAGRQLDEAMLSVAFAVTQRFYELVKAQRTFAVLGDTVRRSEELVARADALFAAARAPRADVFQARVNLGNDRIAVEAQRAAVARARASLAVVLGRAPDAPLEVVAPAAVDAARVPDAVLPPLDALVGAARARRPALAAQAALLDAARAQVGVAQAGYWPTVGLSGSYTRQSAKASGEDGVYGDPSRNYAAIGQVVVTWNLFSGRQTLSGVEKAEVGVRRAEATAARTADEVVREISDARETAVALARQVALSAENLAAAEQGLALARQRLEAGLATQLELRDANLKLTQAQLSLVQARIDHQVAIADLNRAVGGAL
ncbi:MAG TPA: TolC family protein [Anaeromyxobacteraceae bacterium]|nr:TolC family protein [Anaeromyxobacteraceae bacterium]